MLWMEVEKLSYNELHEFMGEPRQWQCGGTMELIRVRKSLDSVLICFLASSFLLTESLEFTG